jgi:hypothetical protein
MPFQHADGPVGGAHFAGAGKRIIQHPVDRGGKKAGALTGMGRQDQRSVGSGRRGGTGRGQEGQAVRIDHPGQGQGGQVPEEGGFIMIQSETGTDQEGAVPGGEIFFRRF